VSGVKQILLWDKTKFIEILNSNLMCSLDLTNIEGINIEGSSGIFEQI